MARSSGGKSSGKAPTVKDAARIQSTKDTKPGSRTATTGWGQRAQRAAARNSAGGRGVAAGTRRRG